MTIHPQSLHRVRRLTDQLKTEHDRIARGVACLARLAAHLRARGDVHPDAVHALLEFLREYADHDHHVREERVLFPWMSAHGMPPEAGPVAMMLMEHDEGRALLRHLLAASKHIQTDDGARKEFILNAESYCRLLYEHIDKENHVLYPLADRMGEMPAELASQWAVDEGVVERWESIVERLENEAREWPQAAVQPRPGCCHGCS